MSYLLTTATFALFFAVLGFSYWLFRRLKKYRRVRGWRAFIVAGAGCVLAMGVVPFENWVLSLAKIDLFVSAGTSLRANLEPLLGMLLFCVPLEEVLKVAMIWPFYLRGRLAGGALGVAYAVFVASGFAAGELLSHSFLQERSWLTLLRVTLSVPAHIFFAGIWGYVLGGKGRDRYFFMSFVACVVMRAVYDHIVFSRGPALLVVAVPMFATMAWGVFALLREGERAGAISSSVYSLLEPPSVGSVRRALDNRGKGVSLRWIFFGALVNLGVTLLFTGLAVYAGHHFKVDFSLVEEATADGILPVLFLAGGLLSAFPISAFLVARASGTHSVLEPAWAMATSIIFVMAIFSVTEPTAIVIATGLAPVGFLLACAGAVFGIRRG